MILRVVDREVSRDIYEALRAETNIDHRHPLGLISHAAIAADGAVRVIQVWDSELYADRFDREVLTPALQALGMPSDARVTVFELVHLVTP